MWKMPEKMVLGLADPANCFSQLAPAGSREERVNGVGSRRPRDRFATLQGQLAPFDKLRVRKIE
jgi:hypothetical protein